MVIENVTPPNRNSTRPIGARDPQNVDSKPLDKLKNAGFTSEEIRQLAKRSYIDIVLDVETGERRFIPSSDTFSEQTGINRSQSTQNIQNSEDLKSRIEETECHKQLKLAKLTISNAERNGENIEVTTQKLRNLSDKFGINVASTVLNNQEEIDQKIPRNLLSALRQNPEEFISKEQNF